ncbi:hypothetical protein ACJIZ3_006718 [Penstemon smallii]|uniref:RRM domain-containing protein n=1 Tax=Penstemon smallii TaxID=265156 RepID=A0ABD3S909_9LAMI
MEMEPGKLFIGGISWDTSEERLREYFETFGEVVEAVIMKDRATGRARGFGFVVFANASVAEKIVRERHIIDGRTVEAKKAVPRDDHQNFNRNNGSVQGSPRPTRTKKIFVGGLASTVTESDFKSYFDQFGPITDVVVMYDHNTQRPRGFGFITYESEEAVDRVLLKTFHELNGKMVEVKRAVPKESSPGPTRSQSSVYNNYGGLNRVSSLLNDYNPRYNIASPGGYSMRMDGRFSPVTVGRFSPSNYSMGLNLDSGLNLNYGITGARSYYSGNSNRYGSPIGHDVGTGGNGHLLNTMNQNLWDNGSLNYGTNSVRSNAFVGSADGNGGGLVGNFGTIGETWGSSRVSDQSRGSGFLSNANVGYGSKNIGGTSVTNNVHEGAFGNLYGDESFYGNHAWRSSSSELEGPASFGYGRGSASEVVPRNSVGYVGDYSLTSRSNRGIAA